MACSYPDAGAISSLITEQIPQFQETINYYIALESPFANVVNGDTFASNQGNDILKIVTNRVSPGHSLTEPVFTDRGDSCGLAPQTDKFGQTQYTSKIQTLRGRGPDVCVKQAVATVKNSYLSAQSALQDNLTYLTNIDIRAQLHRLSGVKFVADSTADFFANVTGNRGAISTDYKGTLPDSPMSFQALELISQYMTNELFLKKYGSGGQSHYRVITGIEMNTAFRNQANPNQNLLGAMQGSFGEGKDALWGYSWTDLSYRGMVLGVDREPLRFNCLDANGYPIFIEPGIESVGDKGTDYLPNPEWLSAKYEVGFICAPNSFTRYVPERYVGEGTFKFAPQTVPGSLSWFYSVDCNNAFGDYGYHIYEIERAYSADQPHGIIPFMYARPTTNQGLAPEALYSNSDTCPV